MGMWAMFAAPLIMSVDLRTIRPEFSDILLNREVIKIDQDPLGMQARRVFREKHVDVFTRPIMPTYKVMPPEANRGRIMIFCRFISGKNIGSRSVSQPVDGGNTSRCSVRVVRIGSGPLCWLPGTMLLYHSGTMLTQLGTRYHVVQSCHYEVPCCTIL